MEYFVEPLVFQVEDTLFRIPPEPLAQESPVFADMLAIGGDVNPDGKGSRDTLPIVLPRTTSIKSFRALLKVLYPLDSSSETAISKDEWLLVLELSDMWNMSRVRKIAINHLVPYLKDDPAHKWSLAKLYEIQDWIQPALECLVRRDAPLGRREYQLLDQKMVLEIGALRESCCPTLRDTTQSYFGNDNVIHWEIKQERGQVDVDLSTVEFVCHDPQLFPSLDDNRIQDDDQRQRNGQFFFEKVVFKVADEFYKVPNQPFAQHSLAFRRLFSKRGFRKYDCQDPLVVDASVTKADFEVLLSFFFPDHITNQKLSPDDWASVLRLSAKWEMPQVKQLATEKLERSRFGSDAIKLQMAQDLGIQKWFSSAMQALVTRQEPLGMAEYQVLDQDHLLQVLDLRERANSRDQRSLVHPRTFSNSRLHLRTSRGEVPTSVDLSTHLANLLGNRVWERQQGI